MTNKQLKNLKDTLWATADQLRANSGLKSSEYAEPILGLIFLRFAECKYAKYEMEIRAEYEKIKGTRMERPIHEIAIEKCGFYLPDEAKYEWLLHLPESENLAQKVKEAMISLESYNYLAFVSMRDKGRRSEIQRETSRASAEKAVCKAVQLINGKRQYQNR